MTEAGKSDNWATLSPAEKKLELFRRQKDLLDTFPVLPVQRRHPQRQGEQSAGKGKSAVRFFTDPAVFHETAQDPVTGACGDAACLRQLGMGLTSILLRQIFQKNDRLLDCRDRVFIFSYLKNFLSDLNCKLRKYIPA